MAEFAYPHRPIASLEKLAIVLDTTVAELDFLSQNANNFYFKVKSIQKADGSYRDTYDVRDRLKTIHAKIVKNFLRIIDYPDYIQGGVPHRDYLSNTAMHTAKQVVISEDITNFFSSVSRTIIYQVWSRFFKFAPVVCECLTNLVTYQGFLVQGAKTSGYLCNLIFWNREQLLVDTLTSQGFTYSRFVDDITISSPKVITSEHKTEVIAKTYGMLQSCGVKPNRKKHHIMPKGSSQKVHRVNVVTNKPTFDKKERSAIRAAVHECEIHFSKSKSSSEYEKLFNTTMGRVQKIKRLHIEEANKLLARLQKIKP
ncbi:reverse transcriptase family protein [Moraxella sp. PS-22]|uniref:Reverse transcriptase family protein n=1 Tax=Moraxella tetraodonis TaxID=2767221 RepID=A0A9X2A6G4_9GAMM|nr:reverse transcriptase family protein [Moraxella tetraodonis]MCG8148804.1 reverse transcriptase family protein [Moraxella tetraodonis]